MNACVQYSTYGVPPSLRSSAGYTTDSTWRRPIQSYVNKEETDIIQIYLSFPAVLFRSPPLPLLRIVTPVLILARRFLSGPQTLLPSLYCNLLSLLRYPVPTPNERNEKKNKK